MTRFFECEGCNQILPCNDDWTDSDKNKEKEELFPDVPYSECSTVCDSCFKAIMDFNEPGQNRYKIRSGHE